MTNKERILKVLSEAIVPVCDDCLARIAGISPRQTVNKYCTNLANAGIIRRRQGECAFCAKIKIVSWIEKGGDNHPNLMAASDITRTKISSEKEKDSKITPPWYWEGNIQAKLVTYLVGQGYSIRSVADTASRSQGKDIIAITPDGRELWISVKGFPENSSFTQARHWFAQAVFDVILYRGENPEVELALALPDGFPTYDRLASRISWLRKALSLKIYWIDKLGNVREE